MQHPIDENRARAASEDASIVSVQERQRLFGESDHVRIYGRDFRDRFAFPVGFDVTVERYADTVSPDLAREYALVEYGGMFRGSDIHVATKPAAATSIAASLGRASQARRPAASQHGRMRRLVLVRRIFRGLTIAGVEGRNGHRIRPAWRTSRA